MTTTKLVRLGARGRLTIPSEMRNALGIKAGDQVLIIVERGRLLMMTPREYARATRGLMRGAWGSSEEVHDYLAQERRSWAVSRPGSAIDLKGLLRRRRGQRPVTLAEMNAAVRRGASRGVRRSR